MRSNRRQLELVARIRAWIIAQDWPPGRQLPNRAAIAQEMGASTLTVQRALDRLAHEGFVAVRPPAGTFVADAPPHRMRYGLITRFDPAQAARTPARLVRNLLACAAQLSAPGQRRIEPFMAVQEDEYNPRYRQLREELDAQRFAGLIMAGLLLPRLSSEAQVPIVAFARRDLLDTCGPSFAKVIALNLDRWSLLERSLDHLAGQGRRRIAIIRGDEGHWPSQQDFLDACLARGMKSRPALIQGIDPRAGQWACNCARLLMELPPAARPDGLVVSDDNLVEHAVRGVIQAGRSVPNDVAIVGHCNWPVAAPSMVPIHRVGFDAAAVLQLCLDLIDRARAGEQIEPEVLVTAIDEEQWRKQGAALPWELDTPQSPEDRPLAPSDGLAGERMFDQSL